MAADGGGKEVQRWLIYQGWSDAILEHGVLFRSTRKVRNWSKSHQTMPDEAARAGQKWTLTLHEIKSQACSTCVGSVPVVWWHILGVCHACVSA